MAEGDLCEAEAAEECAARAPAALARGRASGDRGARTSGQAAWTGHVPPPAERERLASTLGAALRSLRAEYGLSIRALAERRRWLAPPSRASNAASAGHARPRSARSPTASTPIASMRSPPAWSRPLGRACGPTRPAASGAALGAW